MKKLLYFPILFILLSVFISCEDDIDKDNPWRGKLPIDTRGVADLRDGINVISEDSLGFVLHAPGKQSVYLLGDFNGWQKLKAYKMFQDGDRFYLSIGNLEPEKEYVCQYLIDGKIYLADPYATKILDPNNDKYIPETIYPNKPEYPAAAQGIAMVVSTTKEEYNWTASDFKISNPDNMVIYEMLIRDFTTEKSIKAAKAKIPYLKSLGVTAIELMPFNEFEGNSSWGYNPSFYFATDKAYGTDKDYKDFIDECHANGIAVIMDMVLNHAYGESPMVKMYLEGGKIAENNPWFNTESPNSDYSWGYDFNHESKETQQFVDSVCSYWMSEYNIDGFRFDFTKGFTNTKGHGWDYDASRIAILKRMNNEIKKRKPEAVVIFEHLTDNKEEKELANAGIYLWGNMNGNFSKTTMGKEENDLSWSSYKQRGWDSPKVISYMESHDEERLMFKNLQYGNEGGEQNAKLLPNALKRNAAATVIYMTIPGPKMIWQFGELGYDYELNDDRLAEKPVRWDYYDMPDRKALYDVYAKMAKLKKTNSAFTSTDFVLGVGEGLTKQVLLRSDKGYVCAVANFNVNTTTVSVKFEKTGKWVDQFTGKTLDVTNVEMSISMKPGEYRLYVQQ